MGFEVNGKAALVTGANRGIGKAIVDALLQHGAHKVYAGVRRAAAAEPLVATYGDRVEPVVVDVTDDTQVRAAAEQAGDIALLVCNAGILERYSPLDDSAEAALRREFEVNVIGLLRLARAFAPVLKQNGGGALVQLNSVASLRAVGWAATYSASKAAAYSLTQSLRQVLAAQGTQVLSVHPGPIRTDMAVKAGIADIAEPASVVGEGIVKALATGEFHLYPDSMAREIGQAYAGFAGQVIEADLALQD